MANEQGMFNCLFINKKYFQVNESFINLVNQVDNLQNKTLDNYKQTNKVQFKSIFDERVPRFEYYRRKNNENVSIRG
jgi:hypothetical protein